MKEFAELIIGVIATVIISQILIWMLSLECKTKAIKQGLQYDYGLIQGCMIKQNGKWIDYNRLRVIE